MCDEGLGETWFSIAARYPSGQIRVANLHTHCLADIIGRRSLRDLDHALFRDGWVQENLPLGI